MTAVAILCVKVDKFYWLTSSGGPRRTIQCQISSTSVNQWCRYYNCSIFQDSSRAGPCAILDLFGAYLDHPYEEILVVCITVQNLVAIYRVGLFLIYEGFNIWRVWFENAYSRSNNYCWFNPLNWHLTAISMKCPKGTSLRDSRHLRHRAWKFIDRSGL